jgi:hypothetical protein
MSDVKYLVKKVEDQSGKYPEIPEGHLTLEVVMLSEKNIEERAGLALKIIAASKELAERFPKPDDESKAGDLRKRLLHQKFVEEIDPLYAEYSKIGASITQYVVPPGEYKPGQILEGLPEGTVKLRDLFSA